MASEAPYERLERMISTVAAACVCENAAELERFDGHCMKAMRDAYPCSLLCLRFRVPGSTSYTHAYFFGHADNRRASLPDGAVCDRPRYSRRGMWELWASRGYGEARRIEDVVAELCVTHNNKKMCSRNKVCVAYDDIPPPRPSQSDVSTCTKRPESGVTFAERSFGKTERLIDARWERTNPPATLRPSDGAKVEARAARTPTIPDVPKLSAGVTSPPPPTRESTRSHIGRLSQARVGRARQERAREREIMC